MDIEKLIEKMTTEEKAALVSGTDFMYTNPIPVWKFRLSVWRTDLMGCANKPGNRTTVLHRASRPQLFPLQ